MTDEQYALLVLQLAAVAQVPNAFDGLDLAQLGNLKYLLEEAHRVCDATWRDRLQQRRTAAIRAGNEERR